MDIIAEIENLHHRVERLREQVDCHFRAREHLLVNLCDILCLDYTLVTDTDVTTAVQQLREPLFGLVDTLRDCVFESEQREDWTWAQLNEVLGYDYEQGKAALAATAPALRNDRDRLQHRLDELSEEGRVTTGRQVRRFNFCFTIECPHCGNLHERSHWKHEVLFTGDSLGVCPKCNCNVTLHLAVTQGQDASTATEEE